MAGFLERTGAAVIARSGDEAISVVEEVANAMTTSRPSGTERHRNPLYSSGSPSGVSAPAHGLVSPSSIFGMGLAESNMVTWR